MKAWQEHAFWMLEDSKMRLEKLQNQLEQIERFPKVLAETRAEVARAKTFAQEVKSGHVTVCPRGKRCLDGLPWEVAQEAPFALAQAQTAARQAEVEYSRLAALEPALRGELRETETQNEKLEENYREKSSIAESGPYWNVTIEDSAGVKTLVLGRGTKYLVMLDLSSLSDLGANETNAANVQLLLPESAEQLELVGHSLRLNAFVVADSAHFEQVQNAGST